MKKNILKQFHMGFSFAVTVMVVLLVLKLLNWLPSALQDEGIKKYSSVDDVRTELENPQGLCAGLFP